MLFTRPCLIQLYTQLLDTSKRLDVIVTPPILLTACRIWFSFSLFIFCCPFLLFFSHDFPMPITYFRLRIWPFRRNDEIYFRRTKSRICWVCVWYELKTMLLFSGTNKGDVWCYTDSGRRIRSKSGSLTGSIRSKPALRKCPHCGDTYDIRTCRFKTVTEVRRNVL